MIDVVAKIRERLAFFARQGDSTAHVLLDYVEDLTGPPEPAPEVAWVRITGGVLVCTCGCETEIPDAGDAYTGSPHQTCRACGLRWWTLSAMDCEPGDGTEPTP